MDGPPDVFFNVRMSEMPDFGDPRRDSGPTTS